MMQRNSGYKLSDMLDMAMALYRTKDEGLYEKMKDLEDGMDALEKWARNQHFVRMSNGKCTAPVASSVYCDILGTLERMGDHCWNIARSAVTGSADDLAEGHEAETSPQA